MEGLEVFFPMAFQLNFQQLIHFILLNCCLIPVTRVGWVKHFAILLFVFELQMGILINLWQDLFVIY